MCIDEYLLMLYQFYVYKMLPERETMTKVVHKNISQKVFKRLSISNISQKKDDFEILRRPYVTLNDL